MGVMSNDASAKKILIRSIANLAAIAAVSTIIALKTGELTPREPVIAAVPSAAPVSVAAGVR